MIFTQNDLFGNISDYHNFKIKPSVEGKEFSEIQNEYDSVIIYKFMSMYFSLMQNDYFPAGTDKLISDFSDYIMKDLPATVNNSDQLEAHKKIIYALFFLSEAAKISIEFMSDEKCADLEDCIVENMKKLENVPADKVEHCLSVSLNEFSELPPAERWRLYVDGNVQRNEEEQGWKGYENREDGCIAAMHSALNVALQSKEEPLTVDLIKFFHDTAIAKNVKSGWGGEKYGISHYSVQGVYNEVLGGESREIRSKIQISLGNLKAIHIKNLSRIKESYVTEKIDKYENKIKENLTPYERLYAIVELVSTLAKSHPFTDANCRTFSVITLNRELARNGFSPCIMDDPNALDGLTTVEDGVKEVIKGIHNFNALKEKGIFPYCADSLSTFNLSKKNGEPPALEDFAEKKKRQTIR